MLVRFGSIVVDPKQVAFASPCCILMKDGTRITSSDAFSIPDDSFESLVEYLGETEPASLLDDK